MPRIFACLAIGELIVLVGAAALGLAQVGGTADRHILLAVFALLLSCLIQVIAFTYLTVTAKMIAQAVHLGALDHQPIVEAKRLKRSVTYMLGFAVAAVVLVTATGAHGWREGTGSVVHFVAACIVLVVHALVFYSEYGVIATNSALVERTLFAYSKRRQAKSVKIRTISIGGR